MISLKKSYARQLLQLALTLSLLRVDPDTYLGWGWESQLALQNGDGWQLELRAAPLTDYPYSNRKALIPLIEDLIRFDRQTNLTPYDVQTYLLNVQNEQNSASTATSSSSTVTTLSASAGGETNSSNSIGNTMASTPPSLQIQNQIRNTTDFSVPVNSELADLFLLHTDPFVDTLSVLDQNLADLNDYEDLSTANDAFVNLNQMYAGLPLKDETPDLFTNHNNDRITSDNDDEQLFLATVPGTSSDYGQNEAFSMLRNIESPTMNLSQVIEWSNYYNDNDNNLTKTEIKEENANDDEGVIEETVITSNDIVGTDNGTRIKFESDGDDDDDDDRESSSDSKNSTSGFSSNVELTEEVIVCLPKSFSTYLEMQEFSTYYILCTTTQ